VTTDAGETMTMPLPKWMVCEICGNKNGAVYRASPKGIRPARWRCGRCLDAPIDPEVKEIVNLLRKKVKRGRR